MINIKTPADCCGCTACASICPHDAITMKPDALGFLYPDVDDNKCIDCGLCEKVCAFNDNYDTSLNLDKPLAYGARHKDMKEIETSRSGAAFIAISDYILEQGGVVYGAGYTDHFRVVHKRATTKEERDEFKGSKYVQSDMCGVFRQVKKDLRDGLIVLFSGTPCQTSGLNSYVGKKLRENLYLVDIVCHGVPSPFVWRDYLAYLEKKQGSPIVWVNFLDKQKYGWAAHHETFRGWEKTDPRFNEDDKGCSLVLLNTEKGRKLFEAVKKQLNTIPVELQDCIQPNMQHPSVIDEKRDQFEREYAKHGFKYIYFKYGEDGIRYKLKQLKTKIKQRIKRFLKR